MGLSAGRGERERPHPHNNGPERRHLLKLDLEGVRLRAHILYCVVANSIRALRHALRQLTVTRPRLCWELAQRDVQSDVVPLKWR